MNLIGAWEIRTQIVSLQDLNKFVPIQVHGADIIKAEDNTHFQRRADGILALRGSSTPAAVATADCLPLVVCTFDSALALHISRKTAICGLLDRVEQYLNPAKIIGVYIGPHICAAHLGFAWQGDEVKQFVQRFPRAVHVMGSVTHLSLRNVVNEYLMKWAVTPPNISSDNRCTYETAMLPSYRRSLDVKTPFTSELVTSVLWSKSLIERNQDTP